ALLSAGKVATHVRLYAPSTQAPGSSVSHWDTALSPNEIMEPFDTGSKLREITIAAFDDMGWTLQPQGTPTPTVTPTPSPTSTAPGNCCADHSGGVPGCRDATCEGCVCGMDSFCCTTEWDGQCAAEAAGPCLGSCPQ